MKDLKSKEQTTREQEAKTMNDILEIIRGFRNLHPHGSKERNCYNTACDKLDILVSKLYTGF